MAIWGPDAERAALPPEEEVASPAPRPALRGYDVFLLPLGAAALAVLASMAAIPADWALNAPPGMPLRAWVPQVSFSVWFAYLAQLALYAGFILTAIALLRLRGASLMAVYFPRIRWRSVFAAGCLGAIFAVFFMWLVSLLPPATQQKLLEQSELLSPSGRGEALALLLIAVLLAPIAEELYFRGVLFRLLSTRLSFLWSACLTAILFSLSHGHLFAMPGLGGFVLTGLLFAVGFVFAALTQLTGSLRASAFMHGVYNAVLLGPSIIAVFAGL